MCLNANVILAAVMTQLLIIWLFFIFIMNKRLIAVGIFLGIAIGIAFFVGCPNKAIGCLAFDIGR